MKVANSPPFVEIGVEIRAARDTAGQVGRVVVVTLLLLDQQPIGVEDPVECVRRQTIFLVTAPRDFARPVGTEATTSPPISVKIGRPD